MTVDEARAVFLGFSEAFESSHHGHPDFRIKQGIFATLWPDQGQSVLRLPNLLAESLVGDEPHRYHIVGRSGEMGWVRVDLAAADPGEFQSLAEVAWQSRGGR
jgi:hypothetical protein